MPASQAQIDALNEAIATGERSVRFADGSAVEYRSIADLIQARDDLRRQIAATQRTPKRSYLYQGGRGY